MACERNCEKSETGESDGEDRRTEYEEVGQLWFFGKGVGRGGPRPSEGWQEWCELGHGGPCPSGDSGDGIMLLRISAWLVHHLFSLRLLASAATVWCAFSRRRLGDRGSGCFRFLACVLKHRRGPAAPGAAPGCSAAARSKPRCRAGCEMGPPRPAHRPGCPTRCRRKSSSRC